MGKVPAIVRCLSDYDVWNKESGLGWDTVVAVQYALRSKIRLNVLIALSYLYDHFKENMKDNEIDLIFYDLAKEGRAIINYMAFNLWIKKLRTILVSQWMDREKVRGSKDRNSRR